MPVSTCIYTHSTWWRVISRCSEAVLRLMQRWCTGLLEKQPTVQFAKLPWMHYWGEDSPTQILLWWVHELIHSSALNSNLSLLASQGNSKISKFHRKKKCLTSSSQWIYFFDGNNKDRDHTWTHLVNDYSGRGYHIWCQRLWRRKYCWRQASTKTGDQQPITTTPIGCHCSALCILIVFSSFQSPTQ